MSPESCGVRPRRKGCHEAYPYRRVIGHRHRYSRRRRRPVSVLERAAVLHCRRHQYRISNGAAVNVTVRIDNTAAKPDLRLQQVDDSAMADFVLVDDSDTVNGCTGAVQSIRLDPAAANADLTVTLSRAPAGYKIYVRSATFAEQDAAAFFAAIWDAARKDRHASGSGREFAARD
jgi:hypothetical protein